MVLYTQLRDGPSYRSLFWGEGGVCMPQSYLKNRLVHFKALDELLCRQISTRGTRGGKEG